MAHSLTRKPHMSPKRNFLIGAIDSETKGLDGKPLLFQAFHETWTDAVLYNTADELLLHILSLEAKVLKKTIWYSHNAEYDWRYLLEAFRAISDITLEPFERAHGKFFQINIHRTNSTGEYSNGTLITTFRDSMAVYPHSLQKFTHAMCPELEKKDIGLSYREFNPSSPDDLAYARNDVISLVRAVQSFDNLVYQHFATHIRGTIASTALQAWLRKAPADKYYDRLGKGAEDFVRSCYYGGIVQLNTTTGEHAKLVCADINSSYPASMRLGVPSGNPVQTYEFRRESPGFYYCVVTVPDNFQMPVIPERSSNGTLSWPTGTFRTHITSLEIEYGRSIGIQIDVLYGYYYPDGLCYPFNDFIDECERLRAEFKGTPTEIVVKLLQNSLYGKFGTRLEGRECIIDFTAEPKGFIPIIDEETGHALPYAYFRDIERSASYMLPHWAAWITANSRILIDTFARIAGISNVHYRDTDCLMLNDIGVRALTANNLFSLQYGALKLEKLMYNVRFHAPKCYTYTDERGQLCATYKGIPRSLITLPSDRDPKYKVKLAERDSLIRALHEGHEVIVNYHSSTSMQTFMRSGDLFKVRKRKNTCISNVYGHIVEEEKFRPRRTNYVQ